jgi:O-antigen/teichoic acid export membrane protein
MQSVLASGDRIEHRAAKVSLVTGLSTILTVLFQLISVPVCLKYWGEESYGSWLALFSTFMLLRSLDTGYTVYVGNELNYLYHQDTRALREHLSSAVAGIALISILQLMMVGGALIFDPLAGALGISAGNANSLSARMGLLVLIISWVLTGSYLGIVHRLLIPAGLMYQAAWWAMALQVGQFAAIMAAAVCNWGMLRTSVLFALSQLAIYVASALYVRYKLPDFSPWLQGARLRTGLHDLSQSSMLTVSNLIQQGATNGAVLLVAGLAGPIAVPVFTTVRTLANLWTSVTTVLTGPLLPEVVRIHAKGEMHKLMSMNRAFWVLVGSAVNGGALLFYPVIPFLYGHWTHAMALDTPLLCLMLGSVVVANSGALMALHLNGINSLRIVLAASAARAVLGLGLGALGYGHFGVASLGLGLLAGELAATLMTARYFMKHEVMDRGLQIPAAAFAPVMLSLGSTLLFFVGTAFRWWSGNWPWILALTAVAIACPWGWKSLDGEVRGRLEDSVRRVFRS